MNMLKIFATLAISVGFALQGTAAPAGSCEATATTLKVGGSSTKSLIWEWDEGEESDWSGYYFKITCSRGSSYTVTVDGTYDDAYVDVSWDADVTPSAWFDAYSAGSKTYFCMNGNDWDLDEDPKSAVFYIHVGGDVGNKVTVTFESGYNLPKGLEDNPERITFKSDWQQTTATKYKTIDGSYSFIANFEAGRRYYFRSLGGKTNDMHEVVIQFDKQPDPDFTGSEYDQGFIIYPDETDDYTFSVRTASVDVDETNFGIQYRVDPARPIGEHPIAATLAVGGTVEVHPGYLNEPASGYYDGIADQDLVKIELEENETYIFETLGAKTNIVLELYTAAGEVTDRNTTKGIGSFDARIATTIVTGGTRYLGVYENLEDGEEPTREPVTLTARKVKLAEDVPTALSVVPGKESDNTLDLDPDGVGPFEFNESEWSHTLELAVRKDVTYRLVTKLVAPQSADLLSLTATIKKIDGKTEKSPAKMDKKGAIDDKDGFVFTPSENATYRIRLTVAGGAGLDYPAFTVHACAYSKTGADLGILRVETMGVDSTWTLNSETTKYPGGLELLVAGEVTIKFAAVSGFSQPFGKNGTKVTVNPGRTPTVVIGKYSDTFDANGKDDVPAGATAIATKNVVQYAKRTLYSDDPADCFSFTAKAGVYYGFWLEEIAGDPVIDVYDSAGEIVAEGLTDARRMTFADGKYVLVVRHSDEVAKDGSYTLAYESANVGTIKVAKTALSAKENAPSVTITVNRSAKEGRVRVRWGTVAGTAIPGEDYIADNGILEWENGDNKAKTVVVKLIPDVIPTWEGATPKQFEVKLEPIDESEIEDDEYPAVVTHDTCIVSLTEVSKKTPGTVSLVSYVNSEDEFAVANVKKPVANVLAGESLELVFVRTVGGNGPVGMKVEAVKGTAKPDVDFFFTTTNLVWADGDMLPKRVVIDTLSAGESGSSLPQSAFKLKLTALTGALEDGTKYEKPTISAATADITIVSDVVAETLETFVKSFDKNAGITVKGSKAGAWFIDADGMLRSRQMTPSEKLDLTFTLKGPGFFFTTPSFVDDEGKAYVTGIAGKNDLGNVTESDIQLMVPASGATVKFTFTAGSQAGVEGNECYGCLTPVDLAPYYWVSLANVTPLLADKSVVALGGEALTLGTDISEDAAVNGLLYRYSVAEKAADLGTDKALFMTESEDVSVAVPMEKLESGKTYCWRVDYAYNTRQFADGQEPEWVVPKASWTFTTVAEDAAETVVLSGRDAYGAAVTPVNGTFEGATAALMQGVKAEFAFGATNVDAQLSYKLVSGKFPDGMKFDVKTGVATGVPSKVGKYSVVVQTLASGVPGTTVALSFSVEPLTMAVGTFTGILVEDGQALSTAQAALGTVTLTTAANGKLSAKVQLAGKSYTFSGTGFDEVLDKVMEDDPENDFTLLGATLTQIQKVGKIAYTNELAITLNDAAMENLTLLGSSMGSVKLTMAVPDATGKVYEEEIQFAGELWRDNQKVAVVQEAFQDFVGYYTMALVPNGDSFDAPQGNGYLTLTIDAKGGAKVAGALADGTKVSVSAKASVMGPLDRSGVFADRTLIVPVYLAKKPYCFGGYLALSVPMEDDAEKVPVVDSTMSLVWNNDDAKLTYYGEQGWRETLTPVGGWYDKLINLQAYYLSCKFEFDVGEDLPVEALADGYSFIADCTPAGMSVNVAGDALSVDKKSLVKLTGSSTAYDFAKSVNPWNVSLSYKRATGLVTGKFSVWTEGEDKNGKTVDKEIANLKHEGVMLLSRAAEAPLAEDVWTAGYFLMPVTLKEENDAGKTVTRKWTSSLPFNIRAIYEGDVDWWAKDWGEPPVE